MRNNNIFVRRESFKKLSLFCVLLFTIQFNFIFMEKEEKDKNQNLSDLEKKMERNARELQDNLKYLEEDN